MPTKFICWNRTPNVTVFGDSVFGRWWGHQGEICINETNALFYEAPGSWAVLSTPWGHLTNADCYQTWNLLVPSLQNGEINLLFVDYLGSDIWFQQPEQTIIYTVYCFLYNFISSNTIIVDKVFDFLVFDVIQSICVSVVLTFLLLYKIPLHDD